MTALHVLGRRLAFAALASVAVWLVPGAAAQIVTPVTTTQVIVSDTLVPTPPLRQEVITPEPSPAHVWVPGYWEREPDTWTWKAGHWEIPPFVGAHWQPGYWVYSYGRYEWHPGHWSATGNALVMQQKIEVPTRVPETVPATAPAADLTGRPGYWEWRSTGWVWIPGQYLAPPAPTAQWVAGYWEQGPLGRWRWTAGHWVVR